MKLPSTKQTVIGSVGVLAMGGAIVSFTHVYGFTRAAHQATPVALLYPLLTDVLLLSATVCLLHAAQHTITRAAIPRWAFTLGVVATVAANTGDFFRPIPALVGAIVSGWAAVAFIFGVLLAHWYWGSTKDAPALVPAEVQQDEDVPRLVPAEVQQTAALVPAETQNPEPAPHPVPAEVQPTSPVPAPAPTEVQRIQDSAIPVPAAPNGHDPDVTAVLRMYPLGAKPTIRQIRDVLGCGQVKARQVQGRIQDLTELERVP